MIEKELPQKISRLTQKLANNPKSRAFVPLADEYLRQNLLEKAILVLTEGIQRHPTYIAARMMLGNTYKRAERVTEARREFEAVVSLQPENVLAYKKLAQIYRGTGQLSEAVDLCNKVLMIDAHDKQAKGLLAFLHEEISDIEDMDADSLPNVSSATPSPYPEETETAEGYADATQVQVGIEPAPALITDDMLKGEWVGAENFLPLPEAPVLAFAGKSVYNRSSLYQIRLNEWLVSIREKGVRR